MKIVLSPSEYIKLSKECDKIDCKNCVLYNFCNDKVFYYDRTGTLENRLDDIDDYTLFKPVLIPK